MSIQWQTKGLKKDKQVSWAEFPIKKSAQEKESQKVQSKTVKSKPQTVLPPSSSVASVGAQNALRTRSQKRIPHDPNSVATIQRQLDPLAFDPIVKKFTSWLVFRINWVHNFFNGVTIVS